MRVHIANLEFDPLSDESMARGIFNFFLYQYKQAVAETIEARSQLSAKRSANDAYLRGQEFGGGFKTPLVSSAQFEYMESRLSSASKAEDEARKMMLFIRDRFLHGFIIQEQPA